MKKLTIVILSIIFTLSLQAQSSLNVIYVDLNKLESEQEYIGNIIEPIIEKPFVLFISNGSQFSFIQNKAVYQKNPDSLFSLITERPIYNYDLNIFNTLIEKSIFKNDIKLGSNSSNNDISFYFISDLGTFCNYEMHKYLVNNLMLLYNLRDNNDISSNCKINYFLKNNSNKTCAENINSKQISITTF